MSDDIDISLGVRVEGEQQLDAQFECLKKDVSGLLDGSY